VIRRITKGINKEIVTNVFFIIDIKDIRIDEQLYTMGANLLKDISSLINFIEEG